MISRLRNNFVPPARHHSTPVLSPMPRALPTDKVISVNKARFAKVTLSDLQPGDIGFQVQRDHRDFRQFWITVGGHMSKHLRPNLPTDPFVVHAFVVVKPHPETMELHTVDGAADNYTGINHLRMIFGPKKFRVVPSGKYVFFRPKDADMGARVVDVASNWARHNQHNFSITSAVASPFHSLRFDKKARRAANLLASQADKPGAPTRKDGKVYKMSCSELVFNVLSAAATSRCHDDNPAAQDSRCGAGRGTFGKDFAVDAKGVSPPALEAILQKSAHFTKVGYLTENG